MKVGNAMDSRVIVLGLFIVVDSGKSNDDDENDDDDDDDDDEQEDDRLSEQPPTSSSVLLPNSSAAPVRSQQTSASISAFISFSVIPSIWRLAMNPLLTN